MGWHNACRASTLTLQQSHLFQGKPHTEKKNLAPFGIKLKRSHVSCWAAQEPQTNDGVSCCTDACDVPSLLLSSRGVLLLVMQQATAYQLPLAVSVHPMGQCLRVSMQGLQTVASVGAVNVTKHIILQHSQHTLLLQGCRASPGVQKGFHPKPALLRSCCTTC